MANEKRRRQRAARAAKEAAAEPKPEPAKDGALPDIPNAELEPAETRELTPKDVEVVANKPGRRARTVQDSDAAQTRREAVRDVRLKKQRNLAFRRFAIIMGAIIVTFIAIGFLLSGDDEEAPFIAQNDANYITFISSNYGDGDCATSGPAPATFDDAPQRCVEHDEPLRAVFDTSLGNVVVELNTTETIGTSNNFVNLARSTYYDGLEVFRTNPQTASVFSGAASNDENDTGPGYTIPDEATGFFYGPGLLVMSRTGDPDSAGSEYFFTVGDQAEALDAQGNFVVFGRVVEGLSVLEQILDLHIATPGSVTNGRPSETVTINTVSIEAIPEDAE